MRKISLVFVVALLFVAMPFTAIAAASIYEDGNNIFIKDGKIVIPTTVCGEKAYYFSGNIRYEDYPGIGTFFYKDENLYGDSKKGRVEEISDIHAREKNPYTFEYYGNTNLVKKMIYINWHADIKLVYTYNRDGSINSVDRYELRSQNLYQHREYTYKYYNNSNKIKEAGRVIIKYDSQLRIIGREIDSKYFYEDQKIKKEENLIKSYIYVKEKSVIQATSKTVDNYSPQGVKTSSVYSYREYDPATGVLLKTEDKTTYYDKNGNIKKVEDHLIYTYYMSGRLQSITTDTPNINGYIYRHYIDEDIKGLTHGRADIKIRQLVDTNGAIAYRFEYYGNTTSKKAIYAYGSANYGNLSLPVLTNLLSTTFYYSDGKIAAVLLSAPDSAGNVYYHYKDEASTTADRGRLDMVGTKDKNGFIEGISYEYYGTTTLVKTKYTNLSIDYENPLMPYVSGRSTKYTYTYYKNNKLQSEIVHSDTSYLYEYRHYLNESSTPEGYGRMDVYVIKFLNYYPKTQWMYEAYQLNYYGATNTVKTKYLYNDADYSDPAHPILSKLSEISSYYSSGRLQSKTICSYNEHYNDPNYLVYEHFIDKEFPMGDGKILRITDIAVYRGASFEAGAHRFEGFEMDWNPLGYHYSKEYYYGDIDYSNASKPIFKNLIATYTYYDSYVDTYFKHGILASETFTAPDENDNLYYHYKRESWYLSGVWAWRKHGRLDVQVRNTADSDGARAYKFEYYDDSTTIKMKYAYSNADYTDPSQPVLTNLVATYEYYSSGNLKFKTLSVPDENNNVRFYYKDENMYGNNIGRVEWIDKADTSRESFNYDMTYVERYGKVISLPLDGREPTLKSIELPGGRSLDLFDYRSIFVYYNSSGNANGVLSWLKPGLPVDDMLHYYTFFDEAYYKTTLGSLGRLESEVLTTLNTSLPYDEPYRYKYSYWGTTDTVKTKKIYKEGDWAGSADKLSEEVMFDSSGKEILRATYEYSQENHYCVISKTLTKADEDGNIRYEYYDEVFYERKGGDDYARGRLYKVTRKDGSYEIFREYWNDSKELPTDHVKVKEIYNSYGKLISNLNYDMQGDIIKQTNFNSQPEDLDRIELETKLNMSGSNKNGYVTVPALADRSSNSIMPKRLPN